MDPVYKDLRLQKQLQQKIEADLHRVEIKRVKSRQPGRANTYHVDVIDQRRNKLGGKRASLPEGAVDFIQLNASFIQNISSIIRPRTKHSATVDDYKKLLVDFEQRNRPRGRNALESAGGAYASTAAGPPSLGLGEVEDTTRQSAYNADLLHQMSQASHLTKGTAPGRTASTFFTQRQQEAHRVRPEAANEYFPQLRSTLQSTQEQRGKKGRMGLQPSTFSSMSQFSEKRAVPARRSIGVISGQSQPVRGQAKSQAQQRTFAVNQSRPGQIAPANSQLTGLARRSQPTKAGFGDPRARRLLIERDSSAHSPDPSHEAGDNIQTGSRCIGGAGSAVVGHRTQNSIARGLRQSLDDTNPMEDDHDEHPRSTLLPQHPQKKPPAARDRNKKVREAQTQKSQRTRNFNINLKLTADGVGGGSKRGHNRIAAIGGGAGSKHREKQRQGQQHVVYTTLIDEWQRTGKSNFLKQSVEQMDGSDPATLLGTEWANQGAGAEPAFAEQQKLGRETSAPLGKEAEPATQLIGPKIETRDTTRLAESGLTTERPTMTTRRAAGHSRDASSRSGESGEGTARQSKRRGKAEPESVRDSNMTDYKEINDLRNTIRNFNESRMVTQFQKIQTMIQKNPNLASNMNLAKFVQRTFQLKLGLKQSNDPSDVQENPHINKVNQQILTLEEIFEQGRHKKPAKLLNIKESVIGKLRSGLATPAFLEQLKRDTRSIDLYLQHDKKQHERNLIRNNLHPQQKERGLAQRLLKIAEQSSSARPGKQESARLPQKGNAKKGAHEAMEAQAAGPEQVDSTMSEDMGTTRHKTQRTSTALQQIPEVDQLEDPDQLSVRGQNATAPITGVGSGLPGQEGLSSARQVQTLTTSLLLQQQASSIMKMRAYKKKKYEEEMGWSAKLSQQDVFDRTCQKVKDILDFQSETDDLYLKNTATATAPARGATTEMLDEMMEDDIGTERGQFVIEGDEDDAEQKGPRKHSQSMMESYAYASSTMAGRLAPAVNSIQKFDSKFKNQGFLNLQNLQSSRPGTRWSKNAKSGSVDHEGQSRAQNAGQSFDSGQVRRGLDSQRNSASSPRQDKQPGTQRPFEDQSEIPQPSPYRPAHLKYLGSCRAKEAIKEAIEREEHAQQENGGPAHPAHSTDSSGDESASKAGNQRGRQGSLSLERQLAPLPNFQKALFSMHPRASIGRLAHKGESKEAAALLGQKHPSMKKNQEVIETDELDRQVNGIFNDFYSVVDEQILDQRNRPLQIMSTAREIRIQGDRQSLTTVAACQQEINKALISQHQPWVRELHKKYLKETKEVKVEETVFERFLIDQVYRKCVRQFVDHIEEMDHNRGRGFVHSHFQAKASGKRPKLSPLTFAPADPGSQNAIINGKIKQEFPKINTFDLREFLDNGGQIKDLINKQVFLKIFKEIQNTIKAEEEKAPASPPKPITKFRNQERPKTQTHPDDKATESKREPDFDQWLFVELCRQAFQMMLNVKIYMHSQQKHVEHENQLNKDGQQEGLAPATYRTKKFLRDKRRQIKQQLTSGKHDKGGALGGSRPPSTSGLLEHENTVETVRQRLNQAPSTNGGTKEKPYHEQLSQLIDQIDCYYDSYQHVYEPVLQAEIRQQGSFL